MTIAARALSHRFIISILTNMHTVAFCLHMSAHLSLVVMLKEMKYLGCWVDKADDRAMIRGDGDDGSNSINNCVDTCAAQGNGCDFTIICTQYFINKLSAKKPYN